MSNVLEDVTALLEDITSALEGVDAFLEDVTALLEDVTSAAFDAADTVDWLSMLIVSSLSDTIADSADEDSAFDDVLVVLELQAVNSINTAENTHKDRLKV